jgi:hypothetical protein
MEIELRRFMELAVHVKLASEAVLTAARSLAELRPIDAGTDAVAWRHTMDELITLNVELGFMERILRTATREGVALARPARNGRVLTP